LLVIVQFGQYALFWLHCGLWHRFRWLFGFWAFGVVGKVISGSFITFVDCTP
jgi:hypothetical protein